MLILNPTVSAKIAWSIHEAYCTDCEIMRDKQDVRVLRHPVQHRREFKQLHLERVKLFAHSRARIQLQRLD